MKKGWVVAGLIFSILLLGSSMSTISTPLQTFYTTPGGTVEIPYTVYRDSAYSSYTGDPIARDYYSIYIDAKGDLKDLWDDSDINILYKLPILMEETKYGDFKLVMPARAGSYEMYIEYSLYRWSDGRRYDAARIPITVVCTDPSNWPSDYVAPRSGPDRANVSVITEPVGSEVYLDGVYRGISPVILQDVLAGPHNVSVSKSYYSTMYKDIQVVNMVDQEARFNLESDTSLVELLDPVVYLIEDPSVLKGFFPEVVNSTYTWIMFLVNSFVGWIGDLVESGV